MDLRYEVDLTYDTDYDCEAAGCDSICRCGKISNPVIHSVNSWNIARQYADANDPIQYYTIERFCSRLQTDDFIINWSSGYYGDEIDSVELGDNAKQKITQIKSLRGTDLIEFALKNEYDDVLPKFRNKKWEYVENILLEDMILGVPNRHDINQDRLNFYKGSIGTREDQYSPVLLCELHEQIYKVIDGYHRYTALKKLGIKKVNIIYYDRDNNSTVDGFELSGAL